MPETVRCAPFTVSGLSFNKKVKSLKEIKRESVVTQSLDISCGAAGLSTLLNYYLDDPISEKEIIARLLQITPLEKVKARRGFSLFDLKQFAQEKGYKVEGYKMDIDFLRDLNKPILVPIQFKNYRHFVVIREIVGDRVFIADPAAGNVMMKLTQFKKTWIDGIGLLVEHGENTAAKKNSNLAVKKKDVVLSDYKKIQRLANPSLISTTFHVNEW
jgi:predicted double-glycine peptidase